MKILKYIMLLTAVFFFQNLIAQEDFRKAAPAAGPAPQIDFGKYDEFKLDNGLKVIVVENHKLPRVSFQIFVDMPLIKEGGYAGAASIAGQLLNKGTAKMTKAEIDEAIDFIGANLNSSMSGVSGSSLTKHKDKLLKIMSDVLLNPVFPEAEFDKLKKQMLSNLAAGKEDPAAISGNLTTVMRYGKDHPYGEIMTEKTVENISLHKCKEFYNTYFKSNISYLVIVGDIKAEEAKNLANKYFGSWEKADMMKEHYPTPAKPDGTQVDFANRSGAVQSVVSVTYPVDFKPGSEDAVPAILMNDILGSGSSGRLYKNIREDKGYTYGAYSTLSNDRYCGYFSASANVRNEVTDSSIVEFLSELKKLGVEKVGDEELQLAKNAKFGSFARALERPGTVAQFALNTARYKLPKDYYATYLEKVAKVTPKDIQKMAQKYLLPENAHIVVVGNKDEVAEKLARFAASGKVNYYDSYGNELKEVAMAMPTDVTGESVIADYLNAIGGKDKLMAVKDINMAMTSEMQGMPLQFSLKRKGGDKMAMEITMNGMTVMAQRFDGEKGQISQMGQNQAVEGDDLEAFKKEALLFPETSFKKMGYTIELKGIEALEDNKAYKLEIKMPDGNVVTEFYDVKTSLKLRTVQTTEGPQGAVTISTDYKDYKEVDGIKMPYIMLQTGVMPGTLKMEVVSIEINKGIDDADFTIE